MKKKKDIKQNSDNKTAKGFESHPSGPAKEIIIKPQTSKETQIDTGKKEDDKTHPTGNLQNLQKKKHEMDEQNSNGSANAFEDK